MGWRRESWGLEKRELEAREELGDGVTRRRSHPLEGPEVRPPSLSRGGGLVHISNIV